jgi:hypothetical protein
MVSGALMAAGLSTCIFEPTSCGEVEKKQRTRVGADPQLWLEQWGEVSEGGHNLLQNARTSMVNAPWAKP